VTSVGHRRKLLDAIASLGMAVPTAVVPAPASGAPRQVDAERRQLTVMFCDPRRLDRALDPSRPRGSARADRGLPPALSPRRSANLTALSPSTWATGVLIYFGYPQAHEDDAERAVARRPRGNRSGRPVAGARRSACAARHLHRARRGRRFDRRGCSAGARGSSARRRTLPLGCRPWPRRTRW